MLRVCGLGVAGGAERGCSARKEGRKVKFGICVIDTGNGVSFCFDTSYLPSNVHSVLTSVISTGACFYDFGRKRSI
jgi:hypothetical protein